MKPLKENKTSICRPALTHIRLTLKNIKLQICLDLKNLRDSTHPQGLELKTCKSFFFSLIAGENKQVSTDQMISVVPFELL